MRGKYLHKNLAFWENSIAFYIQLFLFLTNITSIILYTCLYTPNISFFIEIYNNIIVIIFRSILIASKYATFDPIQIKVLRTTILTG